MRVLIVGGGVLGTMHAWQALERGHEVVQVERELTPRGASVRNFGWILVGGRAPGEELTTALHARELWERIGKQVPGIGFRANGSLTVLRTDAELTVAKQVAARSDASARGIKLLSSTEAREINPGLGGGMVGALWCDRDAAVEPREAQVALHQHLLTTDRYWFVGGREIRSLRPNGARDDHGDIYEADLTLLCTGATLSGLVREMAGDLPVRRVRLQMMQTEPYQRKLTTTVADGDTLRYYPGYRGAAVDELDRTQHQAPIAAANRMQLIIAQRLDGSLTIGDTHAYDEPFDFDVDELPYRHLTDVAERILGTRLPKIRRRWAGVYAQCFDPAIMVHRQQVSPNTWLITAPGGRGMTCAPAFAERTADEVGL